MNPINSKNITNSIILFGGSFDPIHIGHVILAQYALEFINAECVIFIPCYKPPHKLGYKLTHWKHRLKMVELVVKKNPKFVLSKFEIERKKISYTYITVNWFSRKFKDKKIYFLIGFDSLLDLPNWHRWRDIIKKVTFLVGKRMVDKSKLCCLPKQILEKVIYFDSPIIEISSTEIRQRIKQNLPIKYLVPEEVEEYILKNKIYNNISQ